ncbi:iron-containing alcohol dehydrogenase [Qiania dongpingensis]|uniref:Iron-containing alcohol dehydrogenase n=1 Tax=Qiania dongpingensis TaxID=2763669 RepID=A0A7G9G231_9FIRM|nr:iron-containing alcohol dehydrogenase [Qiania dongpingensis]QNM04863.1 iron-containing alcohol dehydrogenase [Qiania dongpingensis]
MKFDYFVPTKLVFGCGTLNSLHEQELPGKKALIVVTCGKSVKDNGYLDRLEEQLRMAGVEYAVFDKILPNPVKRHVMEGAECARQNGCDFVIGLGGGSSIDASKAIAIMAVNPGDYWDYVNGGSGKGMPIPNRPLPIVAITTTAGTGTETDPWTVNTKEETNEKIGFGCDWTFPTLSVVDPELMLSVPKKFTIYQGFDALFHSTECYLHKAASVISDMFCIKGIELIGKSLARAVENGSDLEARTDVALANTLAGFSQSLSCCISEHSLEHAMSAYHHDLPHGAGLILICRAYYTYLVNSHSCDEKLVNMAKALGKTDAKEPMDFVHALEELLKACGADDLKMSDFGIREDEFRTLAKNARDTMGGLFEGDPCEIDEDACVRILQESYR